MNPGHKAPTGEESEEQVAKEQPITHKSHPYMCNYAKML